MSTVLNHLHMHNCTGSTIDDKRGAEMDVTHADNGRIGPANIYSGHVSSALVD
jgi:hypothetical protein